MRQHRPLHTPSSDTWHTIHKMVLPQSLRDKALAIADKSIAGHLGVNKAYHKIF